MNTSYDKENAARELEALSICRLANEYGPVHTASINKPNSWMSQYVVVPAGPAWILATVGASPDMNEEFVSAFQGIICKKDLPPFTEKVGPTSPHVRHLRQSLTLTGFNAPTFQTVSENIAAVHDLFGRFVGKESLQELTATGVFGEYVSIDMSNRYFTPRRQETLGTTEIPFSTDVDPHGFLAKAAGTSLVHTDENAVHYYERVLKDNGEDYRFVPTKPITFSTGDIVEVQVSFALLPLREKKYKLALILRSLTLFDSSYTQRANADHFSQGSALKKPIALKRRVGYTDEEIGTTRAKLARMEIDSEEAEVSSQTIVSSSQNLD